jgi:hypothetical protein
MGSNMKIVAYSDEKFSTPVPKGSFEAMLNPDKLQCGRSVQYNEEAALAGIAPAIKYSKSLSEKLSFELIIDCTGVVDDKRLNLPAEIAAACAVRAKVRVCSGRAPATSCDGWTGHPIGGRTCSGRRDHGGDD